MGNNQGLIRHCSNFLTDVLCFAIVTVLFLQPVVYLLFIMRLSCSSLTVYVQQDVGAAYCSSGSNIIYSKITLGNYIKIVTLAKIIIKALICHCHFSGVSPRGVELGSLLKLVMNYTEKGRCLLFI